MYQKIIFKVSNINSNTELAYSNFMDTITMILTQKVIVKLSSSRLYSMDNIIALFLILSPVMVNAQKAHNKILHAVFKSSYTHSQVKPA